jgi:O-antigen ligase
MVTTLSLAGLLMITSPDFEESYSDRASSISSYETDASMRGRIDEWGTALRVFRDHPILGVGPENLVIARPFYVLDGSSYRTTHNSFLQLLAACGAPGLLLFLSALAVSWWRLQVIRRTSSQRWASTYAGMLQASLMAYAVGGMLLDMGYFDLVYQLMAMTVSLEIAATGSQESPSKVWSPETGPGEGEWWRKAPAEG